MVTPLKPCGTPAAYRRHLRHEERPCDPCREAHARAATEHARTLDPCGTPAAYRRHRKRNEDTCDPCREAWAAQRRERRRAGLETS